MGPYLAQPITDKHTNKNESNKTKLRYSFSEMQGWRRNMEDAAIHEPDIGDGNALFAVFDGHGGFQVAKYVQKVFITQLKNNKNYKEEKYQKSLAQTFKKIDEMICSKQGEEQLKLIRKKHEGSNIGQNRICDGTGCTANVLLITPKKYFIANAGDSRSVLCRSSKAIPLSSDHKPENPIQSERISKAGGQIINGRVNGGLNLSRSLGDFFYKQDKEKQYDDQLISCKPDVKQIPRNIDDEFILMGCDGIFQRYVTDNQSIITKIGNERKTGHKTDKILQNLLDTLLAKDTSEEVGCDNMTVMIIQFI